ncbi:uncharacterized protein LOC125678643 isoform X3 [Ostrea edulis]|uniref:uncharacterized protein LOC125678643 isoform X3 n=1 Tax=Ostrea edulis TaxID=37623 RepID=UPI0024AFE30D|nr:uncharacterized protein LOC125678643 isoform X3 [Ostrea edulis]
MTQNPPRHRAAHHLAILNSANMEKYGLYVLLFLFSCGKILAQTGTTFVTTPKVIEAVFGEQTHFFLTYTTPDNSSVFTVSRLLGNESHEVIKIVDLSVTTNSSWTMEANVAVSVVDDNTRKVNITIYKVDFQIHDGNYIVKVNGSDGMGQDVLLIRTIASPEKLQLTVSDRVAPKDTRVYFRCKGNTGRPRPIVHLLRRDVFNGTTNRTFRSVLTEASPNVTFLENLGTYIVDQSFPWTALWQDNLAEFRCDITYNIGLGTALSSAQSDTVTLNVTSTQNTQIEPQPPTVDLRQDDLVILCSVTSPSQIETVYTIQLMKNNSGPALANVVSVRANGGTDLVAWQDTTLQKRATATGTVSSPQTAQLKFTIPKDDVQCPADFTEYKCSMNGFGTGTTGVVNQETNQIFVSYRVQPTLIEMPQVRILGEFSNTAQRQFTVGTALQLKCTGQTGSDPSATIRWCAKTANTFTFTGLPQTPIHSEASLSGCQYTRSSTITYNLTNSDTYTQFLCESGNSGLCETGTAKQYFNITLEGNTGTTNTRTSTDVAVTTTLTETTGTTTCTKRTLQADTDDAGIIAGGVIGGLAVLILIILLVYFLVLRKKTDGETSTDPANDRTKEDVPGYNGPANPEGPVYSVPVKDHPPERQREEDNRNGNGTTAQEEPKKELHYADLDIASQPPGTQVKPQPKPRMEVSNTEYPRKKHPRSYEEEDHKRRIRGHENEGLEDKHTEKREKEDIDYQNHGYSNNVMNDYEDGDVMPRGQTGFGSAV